MKTVKFISSLFVTIAFFSHATETFAQPIANPNSVFNVLTNDRIEIQSQTVFYHHGSSDGVDIVTEYSPNVLASGSDLVWIALHQLQPNNPGLLSMSSAGALGLNPCFIVRANGRTGISNPNPSVALEIGSASSLQQVKVNGTVVLGSDERMKTNINGMSGSLDRLKSLRPVSYMFKEEPRTQTIPEKILKGLDSDAIAKLQKEIEEQAKKYVNPLLTRDVYGFLAQDLQKVFPNLVYEDDSTGMLSIDYIGIIPVLVNAMNEQQEEIGDLKKRMEAMEESLGAALRPRQEASEATGTTDPIVAQCKLHQNSPNPFSQNTEIKFYIPENVKVAQLCIYNFQGTQIKQIMLTQRGDGLQWISGSELTAGIYLYALIVDGKEVDVKRMILTE